ncbi:DUF4286 family protein [Actinomadura macra]|uniref:DUF4286 family protein n=1 Tax=Actinomadura macra TaxID=46164 RepID=UPI0008320E5B|nr:DUF4286 family protein [Actinomadura macra]
MTEPLDSPYVYMVGMTTQPDEPPGHLAEFNDFYSRTHLAEVMAGNPGFVSAARYELSQPDARGVPAPRFLAVYGVQSVDAAMRFAARTAGPVEARLRYSTGPAAWQRAALEWRLIWRRMAMTGDADVSPSRILLVGMNPAPDADEPETAEFDDFYTRIHLPELVAGFGYDRGIRLALWREFRHPVPGCPRYCAVYGSAGENHPPAGASPLSEGPRAWRDRDVRWRLKYRRIA